MPVLPGSHKRILLLPHLPLLQQWSLRGSVCQGLRLQQHYKGTPKAAAGEAVAAVVAVVAQLQRGWQKGEWSSRGSWMELSHATQSSACGGRGVMAKGSLGL